MNTINESQKTIKYLVAIDPMNDQHPGLERAKASIQFHKLDVQAHLFICADIQTANAGSNTKDICKPLSWLGRIVDPIASSGAGYEVDLCWSQSWQEAIVRAAEEAESDMIMMPTPRSSSGAWLDISDANWAVIRRAPCTVLIARSDKAAVPRKMLAAVRTQGADSNYENLNNSVIESAKWAAELFDTELHFVNAYHDSMDYPDRGNLVRLTGVESEHIHVHSGDVSDVICKVADDINADTIVIGTNRRQGLSAAIKGNTAEQVLKRAERDVAIING